MKKNWIFSLILILGCSFVYGQENYKDLSSADSARIYPGGGFYEVTQYDGQFSRKKAPKNVILMIGDGMGIAHVYAGMTANGGRLFLENFKNIGFSNTYSSDRYVTDSAAGGTALSAGEKTYNGAIGVDTAVESIVNIREMAEKKGKATGVVSTSAVTHATPASFVAHQPKRSMYEEIAADFLKTDLDVFIGGGYKHFNERKDGRNLINDLKKKGYQVLTDIDSIQLVRSGKLAGLTAPEHTGRVKERGDMLQKATRTALNILSKDKDGFFLMVEGSQIDWGGHQNDMSYVVEEMLDFDRAIGVALDFAARNKETLIVVTADHETGGLAVLNGDFEKGMVEGGFTTGDHTGVVVPVFAIGPGAERFTGFMQNTDIPNRIKKLMGK
ncbi:MAG: alkaline phosphatase [Mangrovibacterium sp.]|nr:alkaline phosphatase [Mangrovibacterium sp.]